MHAHAAIKMKIKSFLVQFIICVSDIASLVSVMENTKIESQRRINSVSSIVWQSDNVLVCHPRDGGIGLAHQV